MVRDQSVPNVLETFPVSEAGVWHSRPCWGGVGGVPCSSGTFLWLLALRSKGSRWPFLGRHFLQLFVPASASWAMFLRSPVLELWVCLASLSTSLSFPCLPISLSEQCPRDAALLPAANQTLLNRGSPAVSEGRVVTPQTDSFVWLQGVEHRKRKELLKKYVRLGKCAEMRWYRDFLKLSTLSIVLCPGSVFTSGCDCSRWVVLALLPAAPGLLA